MRDENTESSPDTFEPEFEFVPEGGIDEFDAGGKKSEKLKEYEKYAESRKLVLPGDELGRGIAGSGTYLEQGIVISKVVGLAERKDDIHFVIPLNGVYSPKRGDGIIGIVTEVAPSKWVVDINSPYDATMSLSEAVEEFIDLTKSDLTKYFTHGDIIFAKISTVTKSKQIQLSMRDKRCRKLYDGRIIKITPTKVPRVIGKEGSMVELIKKKTGCQIVVGQNGVIWVKGEKRHLAVETILKIEEYAHISGLTDKIQAFLDSRLGANNSAPKVEENEKEVVENGKV